MPRLISPAYGNGWRPSDERHSSGGPNDSVVVLDLDDDTHDLVGERHDAALDPDDEETLLLGAVVIVDNPRPVNSDKPYRTMIHIGASTFHEAATEAVECVAQHARDMPDWVACTDEQLGAVVAEHYTIKGYHTCKPIAMDEVPT
ncbi:MAG: hypothetical protein LC798_21275 [Chloroflexi bacterium]|nr:hypothetical protein [Chloroflexota bacterium]